MVVRKNLCENLLVREFGGGLAGSVLVEQGLRNGSSEVDGNIDAYGFDMVVQAFIAISKSSLMVKILPGEGDS